jgi:chemotaxis protein CheX
MDVRYLNPFIVATKTVFKTMFNIEVNVGRPSIKEAKTASSDITGVVGLVGEKTGMMAVSLSGPAATCIYSILFGETAESHRDPAVVDAMGELTNIISGQARVGLETSGISLKAAVPMVVVGKGMEIAFTSKLPVVSLPLHFVLDNGESETGFIDFSIG